MPPTGDGAREPAGRARRVVGWLLRGLGRLLLICAMVGMASGRFLAASTERRFFLPHALAGVVVGVLFGLLGLAAETAGRRLRTTGARLVVTDGDHLLRGDPRPPVVYLRTFVTDGMAARIANGPAEAYTGEKTTAEEQLAEALRPFGPVVAIGRPADRLPPLGAARMYVGRDWRAVVVGLLDRAALVVVGMGSTGALRWELEQVRRRVPIDRLVLVTALDDAGYEAFRAGTADLFPDAPLPTWPATGRARPVILRGAIWFDPDATPHLAVFGTGWATHSALEVDVVHALRPVYRRQGARWPGVVLRLPWRARTTRRQLRAGCLIAVLMPFAAVLVLLLLRTITLVVG